MKENKECKIVQDLLPNYIESLTNKQTNEFIEEHLKGCEKCRKIYADMKENLGNSERKVDEKKVEFLKKYHRKLQIFKCIILIVTLIFILHTVRNMIIIENLQNRREKYDSANYDNYSVKRYIYGKNSVTCLSFYKKGDKALQITNVIPFEDDEEHGNENYRNDYYVNGEKGNSYTKFTNGEKIVRQNVKDVVMEQYYDFSMSNIWEYLWVSVCASIHNEVCNGKECYRIINVPENCTAWIDRVVYIEKETGLVIRQLQDYESDINETKVHDFEYSFNTVTDEIFEEPDISEYKVVEEDGDF